MSTDLIRAAHIFRIEMMHLRSLRGLNIIAGLVHLASIFFFSVLGIHFTLPVVMLKTSNEAGKIVTSTHELAQVDIFYVVVGYLAIAAAFHLLTATIFFQRYMDYLKQHRNPLRWIEYSISCSLMLVALVLSSGIAHFGVIFTVFFASFTMNLSGLVFENVNRKTHGVVWSPFVLGSILGILPWCLMFGMIYAFDNGPQNLVLSHTLYIYLGIFAIFALFPLNMYLSAKRIGPWKSYITTEIGYISLSYIAKTALAILLYFNLVTIT